jgi:hypothetical protein
MDGSLFEKFLNKVGRGYGQIDKNVFGGLLPGGAATPIGEALQGFKTPKGFKPLPATTRHAASLVDAATGAIARAQPFVENTIKAAPTPIRNAVASNLNALPFSVNLFSRYYTGLGDTNLKIPESATRGIKPILDVTSKNKPQMIKQYQSILDNEAGMLSRAKAGNVVQTWNGFKPSVQALNDNVAQLKSDLNRITQGHIPFDGYRTEDTNPLTSPATSLGQVWFEPNKEGYQAKEKYDFTYGGADEKAAYPIPGPQLTPTQELIVSRLFATQGQPKAANTNQLTDLGRVIVGKLPDKSFDYLINIP